MNGGTTLNLRVGDWVEVRSEREILATLDDKGCYEGMPFMAEMREFCGKRFRVYRRADKVCVEGAFMRRMTNAVTLEDVRCSGDEHGGCDRMCFIFWKEIWLRGAEPVEGGAPQAKTKPAKHAPSTNVREKTYVCQSTELIRATRNLSSLALGQYVRDVRSGNYSPVGVIRFLSIYLYNKVAYRMGRPEFGKPLGHADQTPKVSLRLQPGDLVEVRSRNEIQATLDRLGRNRGLHTDWESVRHAGERFHVQRRVQRIIIESTGEMKEISDTVILEGAECSGMLRRGCARNCYPFWREAWLEKVEPADPRSAPVAPREEKVAEHVPTA